MSGDFTSAKYMNKQLKARGLQKLKFYCQVCNKQCRDQNGFKSHIKSPSHLKNIATVSAKDIEEYSRQFELNFLKELRTNHGEKKVFANKFYNELIKDRDHVHMNATHFRSLTGFLKHLSQRGKIRVYDENINDLDDKVDLSQLCISYIDDSTSSIKRKEQLEELKNNEITESKLNQYLQANIQKAKEDYSDDETSLHASPTADTPVSIGKLKIKSNKVSKKNTKKKSSIFE
ncbi:Zinc finger protein RTS2 [Nakaseomyces bracarensis]|uniref:Zinc finger protein RTS2 n=1 Tax=Nakaseomyces bracarensis TaxID=273131 RepID=A0ABR4P090_9SACH